MTAKLNRLGLVGVFAVASLMLTGCEQKDLCYDHWEHAPKLDFMAQIAWEPAWQYTLPGATDWKEVWNTRKFGMTYNSLLPSIPDGVRVLIYNPEGGSTMNNIGQTGGKIYMTEGKHQLLFFNNDTEYIVFNDMYTTATAKATTRGVSRSTFNSGDSPVMVPGASKTVEPPDYLFAHFIADFTAERKEEQQKIDVTMKPLVFTYLVRYNFKHGLEYVGIARGALMGMASSVYLTDGHTGSETATVIYDCEIKDGYVEAKVNSFGAPDYPNDEYSRTERPYALNLEVRLKNGKFINFNFDISEQMKLQPHGGVIEVGGIDIPDSEGQDTSTGGFDIAVEGWGDYIDVPIIMGQ